MITRAHIAATSRTPVFRFMVEVCAKGRNEPARVARAIGEPLMNAQPRTLRDAAREACRLAMGEGLTPADLKILFVKPGATILYRGNPLIRIVP